MNRRFDPTLEDDMIGTLNATRDGKLSFPRRLLRWSTSTSLTIVVVLKRGDSAHNPRSQFIWWQCILIGSELYFQVSEYLSGQQTVAASWLRTLPRSLRQALASRMAHGEDISVVSVEDHS